MRTQIAAIMKSAAAIMLNSRPQCITSKEGHANFVTETDRRTQDHLQAALFQLLPGSVLYGEEKENEPLSDSPTWVVDPIDGTLNYIRGLHHSAISVALCEGRQLQLAAVYDPYREELFWAQAGRGASLNGQKIACTDLPYERALCLFGTSPYVPSLVDATFKTVQTLMAQTADVRRFGSAALDLAYIATGRADIFFEYSLSPWDYAAGKLLVTEAGGVFSLLDLRNDMLDFSRPAAVFASNTACADKALKVISANLPQGGQKTP